MNFIGQRKLWYFISILLAVAAVAALGLNQIRTGSILNFGIDFTGGTLVSYRLHDAVDVSKVRAALKPLGMDKAVIQKSDERDITIRSEILTPEQRKAVGEALNGVYPKTEFLGEDTIGPVIGKELRQQAFWSLLVASALIMIYISFRFEFIYSVAAMVALFHDTLITVGAVALIGMNVETPFIAAILTIMGYSINDTIVIFDRVRENLKNQGTTKISFADLVNGSLVQTMARSINTGLSVLFMCLMLVIFGGSTIRDFALTLFIGFTLGAYSSIFVAGPLLVSWISCGGPREKSAQKT